MWQLVGFYLGWIGEPGKGRALGVNSVKFTGEVLKKVKMATYEINMKRILKKEGAVVGLAEHMLTLLLLLPGRGDSSETKVWMFLSRWGRERVCSVLLLSGRPWSKLKGTLVGSSISSGRTTS